jgi:hypothetical protein
MHFPTPQLNLSLATIPAHLYDQNQLTYVDYQLEPDNPVFQNPRNACL